MSLKRPIALAATAFITIFFLSACVNTTDNTEPTVTTLASTPMEQNVEVNKEPDESSDKPFGKYEPGIEMTFVRSLDEDTASNILPMTPGETLEDNRWLTAYSEKLGIHITYDWIVPGGYNGDTYNQKLNVTLASGDLPDVIPVGPMQLRQLAESNMIADLTSYWHEYSTDDAKGYYTANGPGILGSSTFDGKLMGITSLTDGFNDGVFIWIREDWLRKLELSPPTTIDELLVIARDFTTRDPDGNGMDDTYGFAVTNKLHSGVLGLEGFFAGYHAYPNIWVEDDSGKLVYGSTLPEVKTVLQVLADMYKSGQIDEEFAVKDLGKVSESLANGKIGIEFGVQWNPMYPLIGSYNNDPNADWMGYPLVSADDKPAYSPSKFGLNNMYYAVNIDYEYPEALVKLLNMHFELCWGETGDFDYYYMPEANGSVGVWKFSPVTPAPPLKNIYAFEALESARRNGTFDQLTGEAAAIQRNIEAFENGNTSQWGWNKIYGPEGVYRWGVMYQEDNLYMWDKFTGAPTPTMVQRMSALIQMERESFVNIVMGAAAIDEFEKFVSDWYEIGGEAITREVNQWYASQQ